jgi:hypothetical protein
MNRLRVVGLLIAVAVVGCGKSGGTSPAPSAAASTSAAPSSADIPTSEDYEQVALDQINPENMEQSLVQLERDIGK